MGGAALSLSADGAGDDAPASEAFDKVAEKNSQNSQVIKRLGQEFENRLVSWISLSHVSHF